MINYSVKVDTDQVKDALALFEFVGGNANQALAVGANKALPIVRTEASSQIRSQVRLTATYVRERLTLKKASRYNLTAAIRTPSRGLLLSKFSTDSKVSGEKISWLLPPPVPPRGIKVKVKPEGPIKPVGGDPFYMVLPNSRALAIVRRRKEGNLGPKGGKIEVLYGPSISQVFTDVKDDVLPYASTVYQDKIVDAINYLLRKQYPPE